MGLGRNAGRPVPAARPHPQVKSVPSYFPERRVEPRKLLTVSVLTALDDLGRHDFDHLFRASAKIGLLAPLHPHRAGHGVPRRLLALLLAVAVDLIGELGDGEDQGAYRDRVEVLLRRPQLARSIQRRLNLRRYPWPVLRDQLLRGRPRRLRHHRLVTHCAPPPR